MRITFFASFPAVGQKGRGFEGEGIFAQLLSAPKARLGLGGEPRRARTSVSFQKFLLK